MRLLALVLLVICVGSAFGFIPWEREVLQESLVNEQ